MYKHSIVLGSVFNKYQVPSTMAPPQCVLVTQLCPTLCDLIVCSPPGSSLHGYWSGLPCHSAGDLPNQGTEHRFLALAGEFLPSEPPEKVPQYSTQIRKYLLNTDQCWKPWHVNPIQWEVSESCSIMSDFLRPHGLYSPWNSPGQNTGMGCHSLLQGSNPGLPHGKWILHQLRHQGSPPDGLTFSKAWRCSRTCWFIFKLNRGGRKRREKR